MSHQQNLKRKYEHTLDRMWQLFKVGRKRETELENQLKTLIYAAENNTGHEPSLSCFHRELDEAKKLLSK